jgi:hypothetical protein
MTKNTSIKLTAAQQAAMGYLAAIPGAGEYVVAPRWGWAAQATIKALIKKGMIEPREVERWSSRLECRITPAGIKYLNANDIRIIPVKPAFQAGQEVFVDNILDHRQLPQIFTVTGVSHVTEYTVVYKLSLNGKDWSTRHGSQLEAVEPWEDEPDEDEPVAKGVEIDPYETREIEAVVIEAAPESTQELPAVAVVEPAVQPAAEPATPARHADIMHLLNGMDMLNGMHMPMSIY